MTGAGYPASWREFINYPSEYEGRRVMAAYSHTAKRYVLPGELAHVKDEFGYWRERGPVTFLGEQYGSVGGSSYRYRDANGKVGSIDWHVYVGIDPV